ncbi:MAG: isoleucine--tRNA ligase [Nanoarchaeota archaeon]|nr:isoleucine--tRNA ligase [DPANN group archaeon]MBL7116687.1 isoleucine--tRNA ligase [Nanoarchaeota archaeon]
MKQAYDFRIVEKEIGKFWKKNKIYEKAVKKNKGKKPFYFLDGPPYTSGRVHMGTAWNKALKDIILRYKRMAGFDVWDRAGYDMHGFPISLKVRAKLGLKHLEDIKKYGVSKFVKQCKEFAVKNMHLMTKDFEGMGVWMDFKNAYYPLTKEFIEGEWWLVKQAEKHRRLYKGEKAMHWCYDCTTSLSKHELEYELVKDDSIFMKLNVKGKKNEYLVIWTTTPWTIPFNLAIMVNPELEYVRAKVDREVWIVTKLLANVFISGVCGKKFKILETFKGEKLKGMKYEHPLHKELPIYDKLKKKHPKVHSVVLSKEYVDVSAGTGLVHCAPGCGPEDYEVGRRENIPPFNNLTMKGDFPKEMGKFAGWKARVEDDKFIKVLKEKGCILAVTKVEHDYAHCWRCKNPVIYRTTKQWFFKVEDLKKKMLKLHKKTYWVPEAAFNAFSSWLENLRDNGITRQMYWGTPVPIWQCGKCDNYEVVDSVAELKKKSGKEPEDLHIPWIDKLKWKCKCSGEMKRIPDVLDVWIDAGTTSWSCVDFPAKKTLFKKLYPADFILEGKDQIRGWFNLLLVASMIAMGKHSFKSVYMHGFIQDAQGKKMSKSLGNVISPYEVLDKYGADTLRYYTISAAKAGLDMNYNFDDTEVKHRNLFVFWNIQNLIIDMAKVYGIKSNKPNYKRLNLEDKYILSKLHSTIKRTTEQFDKYYINETPITPEELLLELSRNYIQFVRERSASGAKQDRRNILDCIFEVYLKGLILFAPTSPFITEKIYQNLKKEFGLKEDSIHLFSWPKHDEKLINKSLEKTFELSEKVIGAALSCRDQAGIGVRWPLQELIIDTENKNVKEAMKKLEKLIKSQVNVKKITFKKVKIEYKIKPNYSALGKKFGDKTAKVAELIKKNTAKIVKNINKVKLGVFEVTKNELEVKKTVAPHYKMAEFAHTAVFLDTRVTKQLEEEGFVREMMRRTQNLRRRANLNKQDLIELVIETKEKWLEKYSKEIKTKVGAKTIDITHETNEHFTFSSKEKIKGKEFHILLDKL